MVGVLSAVMVMVQSGSVPVQADLAARLRVDVVRAGEAPVRPELASPVRLARTISDCDPGLIGIEPGADRLANSHDLLNCLASIDKGEPVGRAVLWVRDTGFQLKTDDRKVQVTVRFPTF